MRVVFLGVHAPLARQVLVKLKNMQVDYSIGPTDSMQLKGRTFPQTDHGLILLPLAPKVFSRAVVDKAIAADLTDFDVDIGELSKGGMVTD
jgi:hypothetical protein